MFFFIFQGPICGEHFQRSMEAPNDSARRGSGVSLSINRGLPSQNARTRSLERNQEYFHQGYPGYPSPYMMQAPPYPILMNPPPHPTVILTGCGTQIEPPPLLYLGATLCNILHNPHIKRKFHKFSI